MKSLPFLTVFIATITFVSAEKPLPSWLGPHVMGIYKVLEVKASDDVAVEGMTVAVELLHEISGDLADGKHDIHIKPYHGGRISADTELWSYQPPSKNEIYLVYGGMGEEKGLDNLTRYSLGHKTKITDQEVSDIVFCAAVNGNEKTTPSEKATKLADYLKEKKSVSRYFWLYSDYLISNYDDTIDIIKEGLPHLLADYEDVEWIGDEMIMYGNMGVITPSHRAFALQILTSYVSQKEQPEKIQYGDAIWIMRYPGDYGFTEEALKNFKAAKKIYTTNQPGFAKDIRTAIMKVVNQYT